MDLLLRGKISRFIPEKQEVTIQYEILPPEEHQLLEDCFLQELEIRHLLKVSPRRQRTQKQLRQLHVDITKILTALNREGDFPLTAENKKLFYEEIVRRSIFKVRRVMIGDKVVLSAPSVNDLSIEEMSEAIQTLRDRYSFLNIKWEKEL